MPAKKPTSQRWYHAVGVAFAIAIVAGSSAPWWFKELFKQGEADDSLQEDPPAEAVKQNMVQMTAAVPVATEPPQEFSLRVTTDRSCTLSIDGTPKGEVPSYEAFDVKLSAGRHVALCRSSSSRYTRFPVQHEIDLQRDDTLHFDMRAASDAGRATEMAAAFQDVWQKAKGDWSYAGSFNSASADGRCQFADVYRNHLSLTPDATDGKGTGTWVRKTSRRVTATSAGEEELRYCNALVTGSPDSDSIEAEERLRVEVGFATNFNTDLLMLPYLQTCSLGNGTCPAARLGQEIAQPVVVSADGSTLGVGDVPYVR